MSVARAILRTIPEWTPEQITVVRRMVRQDLPPSAVAEWLNTNRPANMPAISEDAVRSRAKKLGMTFTPRRAAYLGTSKLVASAEL